MSRNVHECPSAPKIAEDRRGTDLRYEINVVTPLFGGGAKTRELDPVTLIRATGVRGHLRFWWRATRGANCASIVDLRKREGEIWGTTSEPSPIVIEVKILSTGITELCGEFETKPSGRRAFEFRSGYPPYALFPFQPNEKKDIPAAKAARGVKFELRVKLPSELKSDFEAAVWGWVNFGGIGARTRRGCGALYSQPFAPRSTEEIGGWFETWLESFGVERMPEWGWPALGAAPLILRKPMQANKAWEEAITAMRDFRQGYDIGRNAGPGRSRWPEPDSIRALTGYADPRHVGSITIMRPKDNPAFPRAAFGLPIVFQMRHDPFPGEVELYPVEYENGRVVELTRMASPLILKPLAIGDGKQSVPLILALRASGPTAVRLRGKGVEVKETFGESHVRRADLSTYKGSPLAGRSKNGSAVKAFLVFAEKTRGFRWANS
jgi:CRISPR-associated protein Cmr1